MKKTVLLFLAAIGSFAVRSASMYDDLAPLLDLKPEPIAADDAKSAPAPEPAPEPMPAPAPEPMPALEAASLPAIDSEPLPAPEVEPVVVPVTNAVVRPPRIVPADGKKTVQGPRNVKVTSDRSCYLRKDGVIAFDGHVFVDDVEFKMHSDEMTLFLQGTNELKRIVAIGNVTITNEMRVGTCDKATYNKLVGKVVMYGNEKKGIIARLEDNGKRKSSVEGRKITFWVDTEQVEVEGSTVEVDAGGAGGKDAKDNVRKMFGK